MKIKKLPVYACLAMVISALAFFPITRVDSSRDASSWKQAVNRNKTAKTKKVMGPEAATQSQAARPNARAQVNCIRANNKPPFCTATTLAVTEAQPSATKAKRLARGLNLSADLQEPSGALNFLDPQRFQNVPTTPVNPASAGQPDEGGQQTVAERFDFAAISNLTTLSDNEAIARAEGALRQSSLTPEGGTPFVTHTTFEVRAAETDAVISQANLDTQVNFEIKRNGLRLEGPGAKVRVNFDGEGNVTHLRYALRTLTQGRTVEVLSPEEVQQQCTAALGDGAEDVETEFIYYNPPLALRTVTEIVPYYVCGGRTRSGDQQFQARELLFSAVKEGPEATISATLDEGKVTAHANVTGGTPPYRFIWDSSSTTLSPQQVSSGPDLEYTINSRVPVSTEALRLRVDDANGIRSFADTSLQLPVLQASVKRQSFGELLVNWLGHGFSRLANFAEPTAEAAANRIDVGAEWAFSTNGLPGTGPNAAGFVNGFRNAGIPVEFAWGDRNAFERDFKDPGLGGDDSNFADNVDMAFYTGHANGSGFIFETPFDDDCLCHQDARWGNGDLEWIIIAACGPLQETEGGLSLRTRWLPAFRGLHLLAGYATVSQDTTLEGSTFTDKLLNKRLRVHQAWAQTAIEIQSSSVIYGLMGPVGPNGETNKNDFFWGIGAVTADIVDVRGYWLIRGAC